jgi:hypothetical protein
LHLPITPEHSFLVGKPYGTLKVVTCLGVKKGKVAINGALVIGRGSLRFGSLKCLVRGRVVLLTLGEAPVTLVMVHVIMVMTAFLVNL